MLCGLAKSRWTSPVMYCVSNDKLCFASVPPELDGPGDTQRVILEGDDITLVCGSSAIGNPTPTISWTDNNGTTVSDSSGISGSNTLLLTITGVTRNHTGNWTCSVENSIRITDRQIILVVVGECIYKVVSLPRISLFSVNLCWCLHVFISSMPCSS